MITSPLYAMVMKRRCYIIFSADCDEKKIADKKIKKIKNRIIRSLTQFVKTGDFALLENRLKFLTGNYSIKKREKTNDLKAGIYYNYSLI